MIIHAYHGWGSDASIWNQLSIVLGPNIEFQCYDRGYFGNAADLAGGNDPDVIITHSMGLFFVPDNRLVKAKILIVLNGFCYFPSNNPIAKRRTLSLLKLMRANLQSDAIGQVQSFCTTAGMPVSSASALQVDAILLAEDLNLLETKSVSSEIFDSVGRMHFLHSETDPIVNESSIRETIERFPEAEHHHLSFNTHNLPEVAADKVRTLIFEAW